MKSSGFILVLSVIIMSTSMLLVTFFSRKALLFGAFDTLFLERSQAHQAAMSGVHIACSMLVPPLEEKKDNTPAVRIDMQKHILSAIMPLLYTWQSFQLTQKRDGIDADIKICISAEEGKLNLNTLYETHKNTADKQPIFTLITSHLAKNNTIKERIVAFFANNSLDEVTQLINFIPTTMPLFYYPPSDNKPLSISLSDLLSVWNDQSKLNPWVLSPSVAVTLGSKVALNNSYFTNRKQAAKLLEEKSMPSFKDRWNKIGKMMYGIDFDALPKHITHLFDEGIRIKHFSVLSCAKVGRTTAYVLAIVAQKSAEEFVIKKLYRL